MQLSPELKPGHHPPAAPPPPAPPRREARDELKPSAAFRVAIGRMQLRRPRPGSVGDLDPDGAVSGDDRDCNRLHGSTRPAVPDTVPEVSLTSKTATSPHGCPGPSTSETKERAARARSARPASVTLSRTASPAITAPALPRPPRPGKPAGQRADAGTCTLEKPTVHTNRPDGTDARPLCVRGHRNMTVHSDTR
jgi:hypothetical protein